MKEEKEPKRVAQMFKILVVDDDCELNQAVCSFLKQNSYEAVPK